MRHANAIGLTRHRGKVAHHQHRRIAITPQPQPGEDALLPVVADHPLEAIRTEVFRMQRGQAGMPKLLCLVFSLLALLLSAAKYAAVLPWIAGMAVAVISVRERIQRRRVV